jgi:hypothetical protein
MLQNAVLNRRCRFERLAQLCFSSRTVICRRFDLPLASPYGKRCLRIISIFSPESLWSGADLLLSPFLPLADFGSRCSMLIPSRHFRLRGCCRQALTMEFRIPRLIDDDDDDTHILR